MIKILSAILFLLLTTLASARDFKNRCDLTTSKTTLSRFDLMDLLKTRPLAICVDDGKFDRYDLKDFLRLKARLVIKSSAVNIDRYDVKAFAALGEISLEVNTQIGTRFDRYDIIDFLKLNVSIKLNDEANKFDRYDVKNFLENGRVELFLRSSTTKFDRYDIKDFGKVAMAWSAVVS